jgi:hypothetical protein
MKKTNHKYTETKASFTKEIHADIYSCINATIDQHHKDVEKLKKEIKKNSEEIKKLKKKSK